MAKIFATLNDPHLVACFQKFFGVERKISPAEPIQPEDDDHTGIMSRFRNGKSAFDSAEGLEDSDSLNHSYNLRSRKSHTRYPSDVSTSSKPDINSKQDDKEYTVRWPFFYYLFHIGAGLGNEMFYCCFFPYWFWNVDGYVCRRLVLTWCVIMYIGQALKDVIR